MNPELFARQIVAEAQQSRVEEAYYRLKSAIVSAVQNGREEVAVTTKIIFSTEVTDALGNHGIHVVSHEQSGIGDITTIFRLEELR